MNESIIDQILELLDRDEFVPFKIVVASGQEYVVTNPHLVAIGKASLSYYFPNDDRFAIIRTSQITNLETVQPV